MNSHWVRSGIAEKYFFIGLIVAIIAALGIVALITSKDFTWKGDIKGFIALILVFALSVMLIFYAETMPRTQVIKACANGPVSIEQLSSVYDIKKIDGKELTLIKR